MNEWKTNKPGSKDGMSIRLKDEWPVNLGWVSIRAVKYLCV